MNHKPTDVLVDKPPKKRTHILTDMPYLISKDSPKQTRKQGKSRQLH